MGCLRACVVCQGLLVLLLMVACSDRQPVGFTDRGVPADMPRRLPETWPPPSCIPGKSCNAHDPCAINPICGPDGKCYPEMVQDCSDGLECTIDKCGGLGICYNTPKPGTCRISLRVPKGTQCSGIKLDGGVGADAGIALETVYCCFRAGDKKPGNPCLACQPTFADGGGYTNNTGWTPVAGCGDGGPGGD